MRVKTHGDSKKKKLVQALLRDKDWVERLLKFVKKRSARSRANHQEISLLRLNIHEITVEASFRWILLKRGNDIPLKQRSESPKKKPAMKFIHGP